MTRIIISALLTCYVIGVMAWSPQSNKIKTSWTETVTPDNVWHSYPRPQLKRSEWINLNGLWSYAVTNMETPRKKVCYDGEILVPFAIESSLSGVQKVFLPTDKLWYQLEFTVKPSWKGKQIILHFGAVDYECNVWVNGKMVGAHKGGNNSFSFDITKYLKGNGKQTLELSVTDPTDEESVSRGKQQLNKKGIWYTPVSGIWKTVWVEAVNKEHIRQILPEAHIHAGKVVLKIDAVVRDARTLRIKVLDGKNVVKEIESPVRETVEIPMPGAVLWTPETPKLYSLHVQLCHGAKVLDDVTSYFSMREVSVRKDNCGYQRICLNNEPIFQYGTLDQGWWPDGLLTPPSEEAMLWDMVKLKEMGFNTIRKHIKVEPELYYYYADSLGLMMWQDMVSGFATARKKEEHISHMASADWNAPVIHSVQWQKELFEMIDCLRFYSCITTWVIFNEGWGQHNTVEIVNKVMDYDRSRIIDGVSGWTDRGVGHMYDVHNYPVSSMGLPEYNGNRVSVLGEFGGYGLSLKGHLWNPDMRNWGYKNIDGGVDLLANYARVVYDLESLVAQGLSAAIYTQTTDVEGEVNGLISYDRKDVKVPVELMRILHDKLYKAQSVRTVTLIADGQGGGKNKREVEMGGKKAVMELPALLKGKQKIRSVCKFGIGKPYQYLSLWLYMPGKVKVWLNGTKVFEQDSHQTRHYNQYNLSDYASYLVNGENELVIELDNQRNKEMKFDYGLRAY